MTNPSEKHEMSLLVSAIQDLFLLKLFFKLNGESYKKTFNHSFLVYSFSYSSIQRPQHYLVEWQSLWFSRSKGIRRGNESMHILVMITLVWGKKESNHCGRIWKDSSSWSYQKLLLIKWTIFRTHFQTPSAGIFEEQPKIFLASLFQWATLYGVDEYGGRMEGRPLF